MSSRSLPTRTLPARPDLDQLKRQAKELLDAFRAGGAAAAAEVQVHYRNPEAVAFALHDAQLVIARAYGFESWPQLKAFVEGATDARLSAAVRARDLPQVRAMLQARPELAGRGAALHAAVIERLPEMARVLMQHGANARAGIYPHREATSALTLADERDYGDIAGIIRDEEQRRQARKSGVDTPSAELFEAIRSGHDARARALITAEPALLDARLPVVDVTPLLLAGGTCQAGLVEWLLGQGADVTATGLVHPSEDIQQRSRDDLGWTPLDAAAYGSATAMDDGRRLERFPAVASLLLKGGAPMTARAAVALGDALWLRAKHAEGTLVNQIEEAGGLLRIAVGHDRPDILAVLLELGFDPDERTRFRDVGGDEIVFTWGMPLWHCASSGRHTMAEMLLTHGADPNADVYASGTPLNQAYGRRGRAMIDLLERHGGTLNAAAVGLYRLTDRARQMLAVGADASTDTSGDVPSYVSADAGGRTVAEALLWGGACGGDPAIVAMALEHVSWSRDDPRWFSILEQPLRLWNHGSRVWAHEDWDRGTYLTCFRLVLARGDANLRGRADANDPFGLTLLHSVAGSREHMTAAERVAFATMLLDAGARLDVRDDVLASTPLGWACRWGRTELVRLYLDRGADPVEADAAPWATPLAWARKKGHHVIAELLRKR